MVAYEIYKKLCVSGSRARKFALQLARMGIRPSKEGKCPAYEEYADGNCCRCPLWKVAEKEAEIEAAVEVLIRTGAIRRLRR